MCFSRVFRVLFCQNSFFSFGVFQLGFFLSPLVFPFEIPLPNHFLCFNRLVTKVPILSPSPNLILFPNSEPSFSTCFPHIAFSRLRCISWKLASCHLILRISISEVGILADSDMLNILCSMNPLIFSMKRKPKKNYFSILISIFVSLLVLLYSAHFPALNENLIN